MITRSPSVSTNSYHLSEVARIKYGKAKPSEEGAVPVIGSGGIYGYTAQPLADEHAIVIGRKGTAGSVFFPKCPCWPSDTTFFVEPNPEVVVPDFLALQLQLAKLSGESAKTTMPSLQMAQLTDLVVRLPPLGEQYRIASILQTVNRVQEASAIEESTTHHLRSSLRSTFLENGDWPYVDLGESAIISSGGTPSRAEPTYWGGDIPWVRTGEINYETIRHTQESITTRGLENSSAKLYPSGTILLAMYGDGVTRGRVARLGIEAAINQACAAIVPDERLNPDFLYQYLASSYEEIRSVGHGAHQKNLSAALVKRIRVPIPTPPEQATIALAISVADRRISSQRKAIATLDGLFDSLLQSLVPTAVDLV